MFFPVRYKRYVIYDIRRLLLPRTPLEERIFLEAVRRIPEALQVGERWGCELRPGALWVDESLHDRCYAKIRSRLRADPLFLHAVTARMVTDVTRLGAEVGKGNAEEGSWTPVSLLEACASAVAWFATNWLHPFPAVRMAIARLLGGDVEEHLGNLLAGSADPVFLQACAALAGVGADAGSEEAYRREWGPLYAIGDEPGKLAAAGSAMVMAEAAGRSGGASWLSLEVGSKAASREGLTRHLLAEAAARDGSQSAQLLEAQLQFLARVVWEEETRHLYQQQTYALCRRWLRTAAPRDVRIVTERLPWIDGGLTAGWEEVTQCRELR